MKNRKKSRLNISKLGFYRTFILFALVFASMAFAEVESKEDTPTVSTLNEYFPLQLEPLWWEEYTKLKGQSLSKALTQLKDDLTTIRATDEVNTLASSVISLLEKYELKSNPIAPLLAQEKAAEKEKYNVADIFDFRKDKERISSEAQLLTVNFEETEHEVEEQKEKLIAIKLDYIKKSERDIQKLQLGLQWMKSQLILSLLEIKATTIHNEIQLLKQKESSVENIQKIAIEKIDISIEERDQAVRNLEEFNKQSIRIKKQLDDLKSKEISSNIPESEKQLLSLKILQTTGRLKTAEVQSSISQVVIGTFNLLKNNSLEYRSQAREVLEKSTIKLESTIAWVSDTTERIEKEEGAIFSESELDGLKESESDKSNREIRQNLFEETFNVGTILDKKIYELSIHTHILETALNKTSQGTEALIQNTKSVLGTGWKELSKWIVKPLFSINGTPITPAGLLNFLAIIFIGWVLSKLFNKTIRKVNQRTHGGMRPASLKTLSRVTHFFSIGIASLIGFSMLGIDITKLTLFASALSIGIGFGLQNIANNFVSGIIILFERSLKVGDYIELATGVRGEILEINIRSTIINTNDNIDIIVPNSEFVNSSVTNWTMKNRFLRMKVPFGVAYESDKELVRDVIIQSALELPYTLNSLESQHPQVRIVNFGDSSLDFELVVWIKPEWSNRPGRVRSAYNWNIETALKENGIQIPFPQREVKMI